MPQSTKYDWMLQRWAEQNGIMPEDSPDLTPADPSDQAIAERQQKPEPAETINQMGVEVPAAQPRPQYMQEPVSEPGDDTEQISEMVGVVKPWEKVDLYLDNWEYRVWEGWIGGRGAEADQKAEVLQDVLHQFDNNATMTKSPSKSDPNAITYSFKFSLGGNPDGIVDAVTKINEAFLALDNYKVISGKLYAIVYYADGEENTMDLTPQLRDARGQPKGVDINDAVEMALDAVTEGHAPESQWERPRVCPECNERLPNSNDEIAQHYAQRHPDKDIGNVYREEATDDEEWAQWMADLPGAETTDTDKFGRVVKPRSPPVNPEDLKKPEEIGRQARPSAGQQHLAQRMGDELAPEPEIKPKDESMQFCKYCGQVLGADERGWSACQRCIQDINAGKEPGSWKGVGQTLASKPEGGEALGFVCPYCGKDDFPTRGYGEPEPTPSRYDVYMKHRTECPKRPKEEAGGMPDLSYRGSPMGVNAAQTGQPKWEDDALGKVDKILSEVEDIFSEHEFYVRIRDMLVDLANVVDMINEPAATPAPAPQTPTSAPTPAPEPEVQLPPQSQQIGPKNEENKQRATNPTGGKPHNAVMGEMGKCAICGLPMTHFSHYGQ
jgi:hypothetical protein